jgi:RNA polymerase sigma factor (sigma-70 family)
MRFSIVEVDVGIVKVAPDSARQRLATSASRRTRPERALVQEAYERHYREVYRYVLALTGSPADAEDVTAEAFERALIAWSADSAPPRPLPWLLLTARRIAIDRWRRARRILTHRTEPSTDDAGQTEFWLWFTALSRALPPRQREVLLLRYHRDLTDVEIAHIMELTPSGVRSLVARALASLRAHPELLR